MSESPQYQHRRSGGDGKKGTQPVSSIVTRNGARKAKIQTRAMSAGAKPSAVVLAAKKKAAQQKKKALDTVLKDHYQIAMESKAKIKGPTGLVTEPRMAEHRCLWDDNYPECPERLIRVIERCQELNLIQQCKNIPPQTATKEEVLVLHSPEVYNMLEMTHQNNNIEVLEDLSSKYDAIYIHPSTHEMALVAAGSTVALVDSVAKGSVQNGAALVRPPGHHAMYAEPCGYCYYNNVALAAQRAVDHHGLERVLIVDWDVHHGQATQQMFYEDPRVVYFSIHRYEHGAFWPSLRQSDFHYVGAGRGVGRNFNVPLNETGMSDADYLAIWHQLLLPMAFEFQPQLIIISAGYDAAIGCPEGEMEVSPACYATLTHLLMSVCSSVCVVLEGGYCIPSLAEGAALTLRTLLGHPPPKLPVSNDEASDSIRETILNCIYAHKPYWHCYGYQPTYSVDCSVKNVCDVRKEKHVVRVRWEGDETRPDRFPTRDCYPMERQHTKREIIERLDRLKRVTDLTLPQHAVGYIYDTAMLKHQNICEPDHVECPERIMRIHERHRDFGLLGRVHAVPTRPATDKELLAVHKPKLLRRLKELATTKLRDLHSQKDEYDSVYFHPDSLESASMAVGCVLQMVDSVLRGEVGCGVCIVRPPGHHADGAVPSGFCLLNAAAAAAVSVSTSDASASTANVSASADNVSDSAANVSDNAANVSASADSVSDSATNVSVVAAPRRVLLLDWDVHHGNGTQRITYGSDKILYISIHRYDDGSFFPHSTEADYTAVGEGCGEGFNINIPWNKRGMGDAEYMAAMTQVVMPVAAEFNPDIVLVSAGFDAAVNDPLGGCNVTPECFGRMTHLLRSLAGGRVVLCLEGGYNVTSTSYAMTMCTKALLGDPIIHSYDPKPCHWSAVETISNVIRTHKKYWKCLKFHIALPIENVLSAPLPSRGLVLSHKQNASQESEKLSELSLDSISSKNSSKLDGSLESQLANLSLDGPKCEDGVHCGTDDEEEKPECSKGKPLQSDTMDRPGSSGLCGTVNQHQAGSSSSKGASKEATTLVDYLAENMQAIVDGEMFAVIPMPWCPHLESLFAIPESVKFEQGGKCVECDETFENWICLHCYTRACGRSINGHMQAHYRSSGHALSLSLADLSAWCSECDAYVDHALLYDAKNNAHRCKFNEDMPRCRAAEGNTLHMQW